MLPYSDCFVLSLQTQSPTYGGFSKSQLCSCLCPYLAWGHEEEVETSLKSLSWKRSCLATGMQTKRKMLNIERSKFSHIPRPLLTCDYLSGSGSDEPDTVGVIWVISWVVGRSQWPRCCIENCAAATWERNNVCFSTRLAEASTHLQLQSLQNGLVSIFWSASICFRVLVHLD